LENYLDGKIASHTKMLRLMNALDVKLMYEHFRFLLGKKVWKWLYNKGYLNPNFGYKEFSHIQNIHILEVIIKRSKRVFV
jgi:hypothetical protein